MGIQTYVTVTCDDCGKAQTFEGYLGSHEAGKSGGWMLATDPDDRRVFCAGCFKVYEQSRLGFEEKLEQQLF